MPYKKDLTEHELDPKELESTSLEKLRELGRDRNRAIYYYPREFTPAELEHIKTALNMVRKELKTR